MKNLKKKGFTIVELVIVIAVIAILAAVLIPTFVNLTKKANMSADQQALRQMNTALAVEEILEGNDIFSVYEALEEMGMSAKDYKPLASGMYFFWDEDLNRILYVDAETMTVVAPKEYEGEQYNTSKTWISLSSQIESKAPNGYTSKTDNVTVSTGAELMYVVEDLRKGNISDNGITITLAADIDMMGANMTIWTCIDSTSGAAQINKNITINGNNKTIKNITSINATYNGKGGEGHDGIYASSALFSSTAKGGEITIKNLTIENAHVKNTHVSGAAILIASVNVPATIDNVTIKNSTVIAHRNAGALAGYLNTTLILQNNIKLDNVHVKTVGGRSGMLVGCVQPNKIITNNETINLTDCSYSLYICEQNTGTFAGETLGIQNAEGLVYSWAYGSDGKEGIQKLYFFEGALATYNVKDEPQEYLISGNVFGWK